MHDGTLTCLLSSSLDVIDSVLLPTSVTSNIVGVASAKPDLTTLVSLIGLAELVEALSADGPFTVFAPNEPAFAALSIADVENLEKPENKDQLVDLLKYHVVSGIYHLEDFTDSHYHIDALNGDEIHIDVGPHDHRKLWGDIAAFSMGDEHDHDEVTVNGAHIIKTFYANNGVIYVVDNVLEHDHKHTSGSSLKVHVVGAILALASASILL